MFSLFHVVSGVFTNCIHLLSMDIIWVHPTPKQAQMKVHRDSLRKCNDPGGDCYGVGGRSEILSIVISSPFVQLSKHTLIQTFHVSKSGQNCA